MSLFLHGFLLLIGALLGLAPSLAGAQGPAVDQAPVAKPTDSQDPAGYPELVEAALSEYHLGHFEEARGLLRKAHALFPNARTLRVLGMAEFELRNYATAAGYLEGALPSRYAPSTAPCARRPRDCSVVHAASWRSSRSTWSPGMQHSSWTVSP